MFEPMLAACPTFEPAWRAFLNESEDRREDLPYYLALEDLAHHPVREEVARKAHGSRVFQELEARGSACIHIPNSQSGDYSDVKVVTPYGEISWERLGRFSDDEMKGFMIDVVDRCYEFFPNSSTSGVRPLKLRGPLPRWNDPRTRS